MYWKGCALRLRNSRMRRVSAEWREPSRIRLPKCSRMRVTRRRMKSAHENLAQFGIFCDQRAQAIRTYLEEFARLGDAAAHQTASTRDHGHLSREFASYMADDEAFAVDPRLHDVHGAGNQNEERDSHVIRLE